MTDSPIPTDDFSRLLRQSRDNAGAVDASSTIHRTDFYGNAESWIVQTYRADGQDLVFLQKSSAAGSTRLVLPDQITAALARHRDQLSAATARRRGHDLAARQKEAGKQTGNPAALARARAARAAARGKTK